MNAADALASATIGLVLLSSCASAGAPAASPAFSAAAQSSKPAPSGSTVASSKPVASGVPSAALNQPNPPVQVTLGVVGGSPSFTAVYLGVDQGLFTKHGVALKLVNLSGTVALEGLLSGDVDIAADGGTLVQADPTGAKLAFIGALVNEFGLWQLGTAADVHTIADLKGKVVAGATPSSSATLALRTMLKQGGLNPDTDVKWLYAETAQGQWAALQSHGAAATTLTWPFYLQAKQSGFNLLMDSKSLHIAGAATTLAVSRPWLKKSPAVVDGFLKGLIEAVSLAGSNPDAAKKAVTTHIGDSDPVHLDDAYQRFKDLWPNPPYITKEAVAEAIADVQSPAAKQYNPEDFIDNGPLDEIVSSGFAKPFVAAKP